MMISSRQAHRSRAVLSAILLSAALGAAPAAAGDLNVTPAAALGGAMGLEVTLGGPCAPTELVVPGPTVSGDLTACVGITAAGVQVIGATSFTAGGLITLGEGFEVASGVDFAAIIDDQVYPFAYVVDDTMSALATYCTTYQVNLDNLTLDAGDELHNLIGTAADGTELFRVVLLHNAALNEDRLALQARLDDGSYAETTSGGQVVLPPGANTIELSWKAHDGAGHLEVSVSGSPFYGLTGLDNGDGRLETVKWGAIWGTVAASTGSFYLDDYYSVQ